MAGLILSRRVGEAIQISDNIFLEVAEINGSQVRMPIAAPPEVKDLRTELVPEEQLEAVRAKPYTVGRGSS